MDTFSLPDRQSGLSLIEVLITVLILMVGLLGMAGLQSRLQQSEMEAYQRSQALLLLNDMANRLAANRNTAATFLTDGSSLGTGMTCATETQRDRKEWCDALQGAGETSSGSKVGAMLGGRGCVELLEDGSYLITVAWQGLVPLSPPPAGVSCGANSYDSGAQCQADRCRRVVTTVVRVADL
ncbi:Type IV pilus modification protein PilV [Pseudomonas sp. 8AS]|uniref:type IV pilus modification protein PilV n=1 Tax=Pseudomonas sp. 8AS TaxID=2653163 RepID=UPI0012F3B9ED|nr:type IV pilus modification protein PilV [Pseudomonas sp. 8AS]VXC06774.1 Type IV pilus modification protein PilV [Pseudomonas sp. 8AS]